MEAGTVTTETTFNYAWCLVRSRYAADIRKGICLLETIFNEDRDQSRRDCVYYLAIGYAKLKVGYLIYIIYINESVLRVTIYKYIRNKQLARKLLKSRFY